MTRLRLIVATTFVVACGGIACGPQANTAPVGAGPLPSSACGHGIVAVASDYQSTQVALLGFDGQWLSTSLIDSGTHPSSRVGPTSAALSAALSGDVVLPSAPYTNPADDTPELLLIDRAGSGILTWMSPETARVRAQLRVGDDFAANPRDVLRLSSSKAYVARFGYATSPIRGADVLVIDPSVPTPLDTISMPTRDGFALRPTALLALPNAQVAVLLNAYSPDFREEAPSALALLDSAADEILATVRLGSLRGCNALQLSPNEKIIAVSCSGAFAGDSTADLQTSGIALIDTESFALTRSISAAAWNAPSAFGLSFASDDLLLLPIFGSLNASGATSTGDRLLALEWNRPGPEPIRTTQWLRSAQAFVIGPPVCAAGCGACFVAEAYSDIHEWQPPLPRAGRHAKAVPVSSEISLPIRILGVF